MAVNIGPKIGVDGEAEYRRQINQIIQQSKTLESQMKLVASQFTSTTTAEEKNAKTAAVLTKQIDTQRERVKLLAEQTGKAAAKYGEADSHTQKWQQALNEAQASLNKMQNELRDTTSEMRDMDDAMDGGAKKALSFGDVLKANLASDVIISGVKAMASAIKEVGAALIDLGKQSIQGFAEQEQLIGGAHLLFGNAYGFIAKKSAEAYKTVQLSQNDYLQQVNGFATGLKTALGGNERAAAELADKIVTAEADVVAATGNSQEAVQNAFNGIMRSNYTMLDNLQLGIKPTKEGFQELIDTVNDWNAANGKSTDYQIDNLADAQSALIDYVKMQGLAGYAEEEAARTMQGSAAAMKSAWQNLITGMSNENLNLGDLVQNVVDSVGAFADNLIPRLQIMLPRFAEGLTQLANGLAPYVGPALETLLPPLMQGIGGLVSGIVQALPMAVEVVSGVVPMLVDQLTSLLPQVVSAGGEIIVSLAAGIGGSLPELLPSAVDAVIEVASGLVANIDKVIIAAGQLIGGLAQGLIEAIPRLVYRLPEIISAIAAGLLKGLASIGMVGQQLVEGLWNGIKNAGRWLYDKLSGWVSDILGWIKGFLGIHSPSKVFADEVGKFIPPGITLGVEQAMPRAMRDMGEELSALATLPLPSGGTTTNMGGVVINVYGAEGQDVNALADVVMYRLQSAVERKEAVFA